MYIHVYTYILGKLEKHPHHQRCIRCAREAWNLAQLRMVQATCRCWLSHDQTKMGYTYMNVHTSYYIHVGCTIYMYNMYRTRPETLVKRVVSDTI